MVETSASKKDVTDLRTEVAESIRDLRDTLTEAVEKGFRGVHDRQDITNGRVQKGEIDQARTDEAIKNLGREVFGRRQEDDRARAAAAVVVRDAAAVAVRDSEDRALTRRDLFTVLATLAAAGAFWTFMVKILPALKALAP